MFAAFGFGALLSVSALAFTTKHQHNIAPARPLITSHRPSHLIVKKPTTSTPRPMPAPNKSSPAISSKPVPQATPKPTPAPVPASNPSAVASSSASPGKSVGNLSPTPSGGSSSSSGSSSSGSGSSSGSSTGSSGSGSSSSPSSTSYTASNWAGYLEVGSTYTAVSGSWVVPNPAGDGKQTTADAAWIGIGGVNTTDLIQVGTEDTVSADGQLSIAVFYELLPNSPHYPATITVSAGDSISASITEVSNSTWVINIEDNTNGQSYSNTVSYSSTNSSAEWIEEDPSYASGGLVPFDNFGTVPFSAASVTINGVAESLAASNASSVTMVDSSNHPIAIPSAIGSSGASFSVTRQE